MRMNLRPRQLATLLLAAILLLPWSALSRDAKGTAAKNADVIIVLGAGHPREARPGGTMRQRVLAGAQAYHQKRSTRMLMCGGYTSGHVSEADEMKIMAIALGVPAKAILTEDSSISTNQNAEFSKAILSKHKLKSAILVTHRDHMPRAVKAFKKSSGLKRIVELHADNAVLEMESLNYDIELPPIDRIDAVVLHGKSRPGRPGEPSGTIDPDLAALSRVAGDLYARGFRSQSYMMWHPATATGHIPRTEAMTVASIAWGVPSDLIVTGPGRRFSMLGETPAIATMCAEENAATVLAVLTPGREGDIDSVKSYYSENGITAYVIVAKPITKIPLILH